MTTQRIHFQLITPRLRAHDGVNAGIEVRTAVEHLHADDVLFELMVAGERSLDDGYFSIVLNTNPYTYLGNRPLDLSHEATLDLPLVVVTFRTMSAVAILRSLAGALRGGGVRESEHLAEWTGVRHLEVTAVGDGAVGYQVDGDYLGETSRLEFDHVPDAVRLVYPCAPPSDA